MSTQRWLVEGRHTYSLEEAPTAKAAAQDAEIVGTVTVSPIGEPEKFHVETTVEVRPGDAA